MAMPHPSRCLEPAKFEVLFTVTDGSSNHTSSVVRCVKRPLALPLAFSSCLIFAPVIVPYTND